MVVEVFEVVAGDAVHFFNSLCGLYMLDVG